MNVERRISALAQTALEHEPVDEVEVENVGDDVVAVVVYTTYDGPDHGAVAQAVQDEFTIYRRHDADLLKVRIVVSVVYRDTTCEHEQTEVAR